MTNAGSERQIHFLGEKLGLDLKLDEKQQILLLIDGKYPVSLQLDDGKWYFYGVVRHLKNEDNPCTFYQKILIENFKELRSGIGSLCLNESSDILMYVGGAGETNHNADELYESLNQYVQRLDSLRAAWK
ncbi:CesT family type III secretion system chaperone [Symbiopectobacterium sp.]|uniref:CesT family type III secretion system chaperone n=1 Tax=Symbiopectobacterium sp. TaxID=2952789 RepID=UPI003F33E317